MQTRHWTFTINNWTTDHDEELKRKGEAGEFTYLVYGYETAASGTPHLQGYVVFKVRKRLSTAKALLPGNPHMEPKRGTPKQASDYCKKDGVFQEFGLCPTGNRGSSSFDDFIEWVLSYESQHQHVPSEREIARKFPTLWLRNERKLRQLAIHLAPEPQLMGDVTLRNWQKELRDILLSAAPDNRTILFFVDEEGGSGKSFFQRYMMTYHPNDVQVLSVGKRDDVAHAIDATKSVFLFNIPRKGMEFLNYTILEQLKDRIVFSPKYDSGTKILHTDPHVVVFCNEMPDLEKMTGDRYAINDMSEPEFDN